MMSSVKSDCFRDLYLDNENGDCTNDVNFAKNRSLSKVESSRRLRMKPTTSLSQLKGLIKWRMYIKISSGANKVEVLETKIE